MLEQSFVYFTTMDVKALRLAYLNYSTHKQTIAEYKLIDDKYKETVRKGGRSLVLEYMEKSLAGVSSKQAGVYFLLARNELVHIHNPHINGVHGYAYEFWKVVCFSKYLNNKILWEYLTGPTDYLRVMTLFSAEKHSMDSLEFTDHLFTYMCREIAMVMWLYDKMHASFLSLFWCIDISSEYVDEQHI